MKTIPNNIKFKINRLGKRKWLMIALPVIFIAFGLIIIATRAAVSSVSLEAESGTLTGSAVKCPDTNASGGQFVKFGAASCTTSPQLNIRISQPANNEVVGGVYTVAALDEPVFTAARVDFLIDGVARAGVKGLGWNYAWDTIGLAPNSSHTIQAKAYNSGNNLIGTTASVTVKIAEIAIGNRFKIYDPDSGGKDWYMNDHTIIQSRQTGKWHIFGIQDQEPGPASGSCPFNEKRFGHGVSDSLTGTFTRQADALTAPGGDENFIWAPHVVYANNKYYMFYVSSYGSCTAQIDHNFRFKLATSTDLITWKREKTLFQDGYDARDPFVTRVGNQWVMYYTATPDPRNPKNEHTISYRTSADLLSWSARKDAYRDVDPDWTESPQVWNRNGKWYLTVTIRGPQGAAQYENTDVFVSNDPFSFSESNRVTRLQTHAPEIVQNTDGKWYMSHSGWGRQGVWLAPLNW